MKYALGIDIGGTNTRVALFDENYNLIKRIQFSTNVDDPDQCLQTICNYIKAFGSYDYEGIGISCPGPLDLIHGVVLETPNLKQNWWHYPLVDKLRAYSGLNVYLENDANLACLAEAMVGEGKKVDYVSFLTISTGVGAGLCINQKIYHGAHGFGHEIANLPLWKDGPHQGKLIPGSIESICSGTAITKRAQVCGLQVKHAGEVNELALQGNTFAQVIMQEAKEYLANGIAAIYAFLDPDIVILGGSVALKIEGFVEEVETLVKSKVFDVVKPYVKVVKTTLKEDSGLMGAAALAFTHGGTL